jgi:nitroimidazol reductase NimA-like FMN-containing flavoprotein (pyridoxamine 5'-phosphate oxidase superfamily)
MSLVMTADERERFLADVHIGIVSVEDGGAAPLSVPVWYMYEPGGEIWFVTPRDSRKTRLLETARRFSLCVQTETPPYRYVSVSGPVVAIEPTSIDEALRPIARRYLGAEAGDAYTDEKAASTPADSRVRVRMRPNRWLSADYGKRSAV